eukprot:6137812-Alexandrium_andersonii.AAC.1
MSCALNRVFAKPWRIANPTEVLTNSVCVCARAHARRCHLHLAPASKRAHLCCAHLSKPAPVLGRSAEHGVHRAMTYDQPHQRADTYCARACMLGVAKRKSDTITTNDQA